MPSWLRSLCGYLFVLLAWLHCSEASTAPRTDRLGDPLPPDALARLGTLRLRHDASVTALAFAPDGKTLASSDYFGIVRIWEMPGGRELHCLRIQANAIYALAYSIKGKYLACLADDGVFLWDTMRFAAPTGERLFGQSESLLCRGR